MLGDSCVEPSITCGCSCHVAAASSPLSGSAMQRLGWCLWGTSWEVRGSECPYNLLPGAFHIGVYWKSNWQFAENSCIIHEGRPFENVVGGAKPRENWMSTSEFQAGSLRPEASWLVSAAKFAGWARSVTPISPSKPVEFLHVIHASRKKLSRGDFGLCMCGLSGARLLASDPCARVAKTWLQSLEILPLPRGERTLLAKLGSVMGLEQVTATEEIADCLSLLKVLTDKSVSDPVIIS